jgi:SH3 domain-containing YSC84-like protein 1
LANPHFRLNVCRKEQLCFNLRGELMKKFCITLVPLLACTLAFPQEKERDRLQEAGNVLKEILDIPDDIPKSVLDRAECVIVIPSVKKLAVGIGASYGRGAMSCRTGEHFTGGWSAPSMFALEGANIGFQLGGQATDFVLLVNSPHGVESLLKSKVKLGGDASAAAGPKGRDAEAATDVTMRAEILSYSRARGLFAGISLEGSTLRQDNGANEKVYGRKITAREIVRQGRVGTPGAGQVMVATLNHASPHNKSEPKSLGIGGESGKKKS